jgi:hypothetical protein
MSIHMVVNISSLVYCVCLDKTFLQCNFFLMFIKCDDSFHKEIASRFY